MTNIIELGLDITNHIISGAAHVRDFLSTRFDKHVPQTDENAGPLSLRTSHKARTMAGIDDADRETDDRRLLGDARVSRSAIPISTPSSRSQYHPTRTSRQFAMRARDPDIQGQLQLRKSRGENIKNRAEAEWLDSTFDDNTDNKRRRTGLVTPTRSRVIRQARAVDLTGDDNDDGDRNVDSHVGKQERLARSMLPPTSTPHPANTTISASRSLKLVRSQTTIAPNFGAVHEYTNVNDKMDQRRRSKQAVSSGPSAKAMQAQPAIETIDLDADSPKRTHTATSRQPNRSLVSEPANRPLSSDVKSSEDIAIFEDPADADLDFAEPTALGMQRQRELDAEQRRETRAARNAYIRANVKHYDSSESEDELARDAPIRSALGQGGSSLSSNIRPNNRLAHRQDPGLSRPLSDDRKPVTRTPATNNRIATQHDIQRSEFFNSKTTASSYWESEGTSGYMFKLLYSDSIPQGVGDGILYPATRGYYVRKDNQRLVAFLGSRMREAEYSSNIMILTGPDNHWAAIQFRDTPEASGFRSKLKHDFAQMRFKDVGSKDVIQDNFSKLLHRQIQQTRRSSSGLESHAPPSDVDYLERKQQPSRSRNPVGAELQSTGKPLRERGARLVSQMTTTEHANGTHVDQDDEISGDTGITIRGKRGLGDRVEAAHRHDDDDVVVQIPEQDMKRRSLRHTTNSRYFDLADEGDVVAATVPDDQRYSRTVGLGDPWRFSLTYPLLGKDRATVEWQDLERLDDGEFLNDNLIEFYLRWARHQQLEKGTYKESQVHFFNTFFYEKLASGRSIDHKAVESWTRKVNIFDIDYIVVPVNESTHWYVCIICNLPNLRQSPEVTDLTNEEDADDGQKIAVPEPVDISDDAFTQMTPAANDTAHPVAHSPSANDTLRSTPETLVRDDTTPILTSDLPGSETEHATPAAMASQDSISLTRNDGVFKDAKLSSPRSGRGRRRRSGPAPRKYDPSTTIIITLDSLGLTHAKTTSNLKDYVVAEAAARLKLDVKKEEIKGMNVTRGIPQQQNFCDCGVFLLGYVHAFLNDPRRFINKILSNEMDAEEDWPDMDPKRLRANVRETIQKTYADQLPELRKMMQLKRKLRTTDAGKGNTMGAKVQAVPGAGVTPAERRPVNAVNAQARRPASNSDHPGESDATPTRVDQPPAGLPPKHVSSPDFSVVHTGAREEDVSEDVMLLDNPQSSIAGAESGDSSDTGSPMDSSIRGGTGSQHHEQHAGRTLDRRHSREPVYIGEIPDSQDIPGARSQSAHQADDEASLDHIAAVEAIDFPAFPTRSKR